jgi:ADP-ribose pyrophosphatase YjhB (NUDIX family)
MPLPEPARYCPRCGTPLEGAPLDDAQHDGVPRPTCPRDGYRWFPDPKVAVGVLVVDEPNGTSHEAHRGHLLLVRRNHDPALGAWAFPSGFVDAGEVLEEAAVREVREEANVEVVLDGLLGAWSDRGNPVVFLAYAGHLVAGTPSPGDEASEVGWFPTDALPPLAFAHDDEIVALWLRARATPAGREGAV